MKLKSRKKNGDKIAKLETLTYIAWDRSLMLVYINEQGLRIMKKYNSLAKFNTEWKDEE